MSTSSCARPSRDSRVSILAALAALAVLPACGGGGADGGGGGPTPGAFEPSASYAARCAAPRTGIDPATDRPYADVQGSTLDEKRWLRSWTHELYLWYGEVQDVGPLSSAYPTPQAYFQVMKTFAKTASGADKDRFHYSVSTQEWNDYSQSGLEVGYGVTWVILSGTPPRRTVALYAEPGSPAAGIVPRGAAVLAVDGVSIDALTNVEIDHLNEGLFSPVSGRTYRLTIRPAGSSVSTDVSLLAGPVTTAPVHLVKTLDVDGKRVGYLFFNSHIATAERALVDAVAQLQAAGIDELVLDMRYNGGGLLAVASQLAYMIAGPARTGDRTFEKESFNDQHPVTDPVTRKAIVPMPFVDQTVGFSLDAGQALPHLTLSRVYVLTGAGTCSASEALINGLRGVDFDVVLVGDRTCGKPYGFYPQDNCGTTYFSIEMRGVNAKGFGDYGDGFVPGGTGVAGVPGCAVADDLTRPLGDPAEGRLAAALQHIRTGTCTASSALRATSRASADADPAPARPAWKQLRIVR